MVNPMARLGVLQKEMLTQKAIVFARRGAEDIAVGIGVRRVSPNLKSPVGR